jgi:pantoate--beta-alanine ligase
MSNPMMIVSTLDELRSARAILNEPVGLVPTMGFLHEGHLSLVRRAREECASVAVSIFVNPTQFSPEEDLDSYPRDLERDLGLLERLGVNLVWTPTPGIMYPSGYQTWVQVDALTKPLEGAQRPGHFRGVTTVVTKLFNGVQPDRAYFGQKDAQQVAVIRQMVRDMDFDLQVVVCPIQREPDGLAMSSRNTYLSPRQRADAVILHHSLCEAERQIQKDGQRSARAVAQSIRERIGTVPDAVIDYVEVVRADDLTALESLQGEILIALAVRFGKTRLIDNLQLKVS